MALLSYSPKNYEKTKRPEEDTNGDALRLAQDFYGNPKLKSQEVRPTKLVDFEKIAKHFDINIRLFEPKTDSQDQRSISLLSFSLTHVVTTLHTRRSKMVLDVR